MALRRVGSHGGLRVQRGDLRVGANPQVSGPRGDRPLPAARGDECAAHERTAPHFGRVPLTEQQRELAVNYLPMARQLAQRMYVTWRTHREELAGGGCSAI